MMTSENSSFSIHQIKSVTPLAGPPDPLYTPLELHKLHQYQGCLNTGKPGLDRIPFDHVVLFSIFRDKQKGLCLLFFLKNIRRPFVITAGNIAFSEFMDKLEVNSTASLRQFAHLLCQNHPQIRTDPATMQFLDGEPAQDLPAFVNIQGIATALALALKSEGIAFDNHTASVSVGGPYPTINPAGVEGQLATKDIVAESNASLVSMDRILEIIPGAMAGIIISLIGAVYYEMAMTIRTYKGLVSPAKTFILNFEFLFNSGFVSYFFLIMAGASLILGILAILTSSRFYSIIGKWRFLFLAIIPALAFMMHPYLLSRDYMRIRDFLNETVLIENSSWPLETRISLLQDYLTRSFNVIENNGFMAMTITDEMFMSIETFFRLQTPPPPRFQPRWHRTRKLKNTPDPLATAKQTILLLIWKNTVDVNNWFVTLKFRTWIKNQSAGSTGPPHQFSDVIQNMGALDAVKQRILKPPPAMHPSNDVHNRPKTP